MMFPDDEVTATQRRPRILAVEDDAAVLKLLEKLLAFAEVIPAHDGLEAWEILDAGPAPDLVITDLMMPRMDGIELSQKIKDDPRFEKLPIVMLTARGAPRDVIAGINAGARHYVTKPFKHADLLDKVLRALRSSA